MSTLVYAFTKLKSILILNALFGLPTFEASAPWAVLLTTMKT